jgi:hypothetical protein
MTRNIIFVLMYRRHKLLDLIENIYHTHRGINYFSLYFKDLYMYSLIFQISDLIRL